MTQTTLQISDPPADGSPVTHASGPQWSYRQHLSNEIELADNDLPSCFSQTDTIDAWRQTRMRDFVSPLLEAYPDATWMTVGDLYGEDARYLKGRGADVVATSLSDHLLQIAKQHGLVDKCRAENAEDLSADDDSFDFVLCKEAYHHFPRPAVGFYEMLRVAKRGVLLIEPQESFRGPIDVLKTLAKRVLRGDPCEHFEPWGNFIYRLRVQEVKKMLTGLNYTTLAFRRFNDFYHPRLAPAKYSPKSVPTLLTKLGIGLQNLLCRMRLLDYGLVSVVAFKETPTPAAERALKQAGFRVVDLPRNPYLSASSTGPDDASAAKGEL
jgi:SAM-dependent methyltransferase